MSKVDYGWNSPSLLVDGQPQSDSVVRGQYRYYQKHVGIEQGSVITFTLSPTSGDPDMYITNSRDREPGRDQYDLKSTKMAGAESIVIRPGDDLYCVDCIFYISVYGFKDASYSIVAATGVTMLACGQVANGMGAANEMSYFSYYHDDTDGDLEIIMTALTGDPDLYVTAGQGAAIMPTVDYYTWSAKSMGSDGILISKDDPNHCSNCEYNIGVFAWSAPSTYTLMMNGGECMMTLYPGRPQASILEAGEMKVRHSMSEATRS